MRFPFLQQAACTPLAALAFIAAALVPIPAQACSTCKCGDYTITLFGAEKPFADRFRLGLDAIYRSESQGAGLEQQDTDERRLLLGAAWSVNRDLTLALQIPWVRKQIESANLAKSEAEGLGDIDLIGRYVLLRGGGMSGRHLAGLRVGLRLPTADEIKDQGQKLNIDVQPDAGSTVPNIGAWYSYFSYPWFASASLTYFSFSDAHQDFSPGDALVASVLAQYAVQPKLALQFGLDARHSERNRFSGVADPDSGGRLAMAFAGIAVRALDELLLSAGVQVPVAENLNGEQEEDPSFRLGLAYDLSFKE